jgi:hypothetical protein
MSARRRCQLSVRNGWRPQRALTERVEVYRPWILSGAGRVEGLISNVGTAVVPYSIHQRVHEAGAVAYVTARLVECTFIAIGIVCMLAISSLRQDAPPGTDAAVGQGIFAVYE